MHARGFRFASERFPPDTSDAATIDRRRRARARRERRTGDVLDVFARVNTRNLALLDRHLADPAAARRASRRFLWLVGGAIVIGLVALVALALVALRWLIGLLQA